MSTRPIVRVAAHVPFGYCHDAYQTPGFHSALQYEHRFAKKTKSHRISRDYVARFNHLLQDIHSSCMNFKAAGFLYGFQDKNLFTDVVDLELELGNDYIMLTVIGIRPCFVGHKAFQVLMLQLLQTACLLKKRFIVESCYPRTVAILRHLFGPSLMRIVDESTACPNCVFDDLHAMQMVTPESLGIAGYVTATCPVQLIEAAFPTSEQLNDVRYVDAFYASRAATSRVVMSMREPTA